MAKPRIVRFFIGNLIAATATLLGLLVVTFAIGRLLPIDPVLAAMGDRASAEAIAHARVEMGLDLPLHRQFEIYVGHALRGDFGESVLTGRPVIADIARVFPATLELATAAILIGLLLGVPMGVAGAVWRGHWPDHLIRVIGLLGYSVPIFWLGLMGLLIFYAKLGWVAGPGRIDVYYDGIVPPVTGALVVDSLIAGNGVIFVNVIRHLVLPASILGFFSLAYLSRMTRGFMIEQLSRDYITAARIKGLSELRVIWVHALGNVLVPLITVIALGYGSLLEGSVLTETVFSWPGLGLYITHSLLSADMNAVLGGTLVVGAVFVGLNLLAESLYPVLDPRAR